MIGGDLFHLGEVECWQENDACVDPGCGDEDVRSAEPCTTFEWFDQRVESIDADDGEDGDGAGRCKELECND